MASTNYRENRFLTGHHRPNRMEVDAPDLFVEGELPADLAGVFYCNGAEPLYPPTDEDYHWFDDDGMVYAFFIEDGRVSMRKSSSTHAASTRLTTHLIDHQVRQPLVRLNATQTVFGEGPVRAWMMMVGEQPGDQKDRAGEPFVGPAGRLLDRALADAGIDRSAVYLTNAVKQFKFTERGKRRIHQKPAWTEVVACHPWLLGELAAVEPALVVCLGAVAAQALLGTSFRLTRHRGEVMDLPDSPARVTATLHPSAVLRAENRDEAYQSLVKDLVAACAAIA